MHASGAAQDVRNKLTKERRLQSRAEKLGAALFASEESLKAKREKMIQLSKQLQDLRHCASENDEDIEAEVRLEMDIEALEGEIQSHEFRHVLTQLEEMNNTADTGTQHVRFTPRTSRG